MNINQLTLTNNNNGIIHLSIIKHMIFELKESNARLKTLIFHIFNYY